MCSRPARAERAGKIAAKHADPCIHGGQPHGLSRPEQDRDPNSAIVGQRHLAIRSAVDVVEDHAGHAATGERRKSSI